MAPINIGIIGLSASAVTSWASTAHLPYLLSARGRAKYRIVALCNSSLDAARAAIAHYKLDPNAVTPYGDPAALAADPGVELVVCSTRVDTHHRLVRPSVEAGKAAFVEWPLTHDVELSRDLVELARGKGARLTAVGLQGRLEPVAGRVRELLRGKSLGKVLSSEVRAAGGTVDREALTQGLEYFTKREVGGNVFMIGFAHLFDLVQSVLGEVVNLKGTLQLQRPDVKLRDPTTKTIVKTVRSDVPDLVVASGSLEKSGFTQLDATFSIRYRRGQPFKGEAALTWHINCEKGELRITSPGAAALQAAAHDAPVTIEIHHFETDTVETVEWSWPAWFEEEKIPPIGRNVASLYEAFAEDKRGGFPTFEDALARHEQLDGLLSGWQAKV